MTKLEQLERDLQQFTTEERAEFRAWYEAWDAAEWDRQLEAHVAAGKLDRVAELAIADCRAGARHQIGTGG
jgi:hypothetical protein